ncbi:PLP-dependent transferase [Stereum hirsutum FP-91666 SS1]|uniref:PLP-dependent transferase n=1 Tax=Stereum hirsutum (strain FP-91666) TaxID=721885 RepID=UPI000440C689|nr:PLP-dependent transferase [Stereum hirsutum FP-91666 SS1]EIM91560.1 PLP-dependent transferase [Stereum hirsutum FP-91666 SS1]
MTSDSSKTVPNGIDGIPPPISDAQTKTSENKPTTVLPAEHYDYFLSDIAKARKPSPIRGLFPLERTPGVISLLAGKPNASTFPFTSLSFTARAPPSPNANAQDTPKEHSITLTADELNEGLQYGSTSGLEGINDWLTELQESEHGRKREGEGWRLSVTAGSQDGIYKAVMALVNPGDSMLVEKPVYAGVIPIFQSVNAEMIEVETDSEGINSASLRSILESWPANKPKPKVLYTVPYGCNPTGMTATLHRRLEVLELAREHNFLILEDDPYYYLYYGKSPRSSFPSYFSLEASTGGTLGHVVRFDSLSKVLSAGIRVGFVTGPVRIVNAIDMHTASANLQPSSLIQSITHALLREWGHAGFIAHTHTVSEFYRLKRDVFEAALQEFLGKEGLAEWSTPEAGMFFWFKLLNPAATDEEGDSESLIRTKAFENGVLALPGTVFLPNGAKTAYVRASFSLLEEAEVREALRRLREVLVREREASA